MRVAISTLLAAAALAGCATSPPVVPTSNFVTAGAGDQAKLASDAAGELASLYAPAKTMFVWSQPQQSTDVFGAELLADLRKKGFAIREPGAAAPDGAASAPAAPAAPEWPVRYALDQVVDAGVYRVVLVVGQQSIVRAYVIRDGAFAPVGAWSRKE